VADESNKTLEELRRQIEREARKQFDQREEIKKAQAELRTLRKNKADLAESRSKNEEAIRKLKIELAEDREIARDKSLDEGVREAARERIEEHQNSIRAERHDISRQDASISGINTRIQRTLGNKEFRESMLSSSRTMQREVSSRVRGVESASRLTPQQLRGDLSKNISPDNELESMRAGDSIRRMGGTKGEQQQVQQATNEFLSLFGAVKEARKALAGMTEDTEEYREQQEELTRVQGEATAALARAEKVEREVEKRKLAAAQSPNVGSRFMSAAGAVAQFGSDAFNRLGTGATERYTLEEERKQADMRLRNMSLQDTRNRTSDATAFLSTGGGGMFGAEMPFDRRGNVTGSIDSLSTDFMSARRSMPQYALAYKALSGMADVGQNVLAKGVEGAGLTGVSGLTYAGGEAIRGLGGLGLNTLREGMLTPEVGGSLGGKQVASLTQSVLSGGIGMMRQGGQFGLGGMAEWGGGNRDMAERGVGRISNAADEVATALPRVLTRAYEAVDQMNQLVKTEQSAAQASRVRERLQMAFAPAMQQYMDAQDASAGAMKSRYMSRGQRQGYERELEMFSLDEDLSDRGFGVNEIMGNTSQAAMGLGRFGAGGRSERVAKSGMLAESMGLGSAGQNIGSMMKMSASGADDPEALFTKAVKEGLQKGLQDSRQFQQLLDSAAATSQGVDDFDGALRGILTFAGSGRSNDVDVASQASKTAEDRMSGKTGTWRDMVKFDVTNKAAQKAIAAARDQGIELSREDQTSLQNLANQDVKALENPEFLNSILTSGAQRAIQASGQTVDQYGKGLARNLRVQGTLADSVNATQSPELAELKNSLAEGNYDQIREKYKGNPGRLRDLVALAGSGASASGNAQDALGAQQMIVNGLKEAGIDTTGMGVQRSFKPVSAEEALAESGSAMTGLDQRRRGRARIGQIDQATAMSVARDGEGKSLFAEEMARSPEMYEDQQSKMVRAGQEMRTAEIPNDKMITPIDEAVKEVVKGLQEIKEAFKDFKVGEFVVNAGQDVVIQGAKAIKGVMLDNGLTQAASEAGKVIADTVKGAFGSNDKTAPAPKAGGPAKSVPAP